MGTITSHDAIHMRDVKQKKKLLLQNAMARCECTLSLYNVQ